MYTEFEPYEDLANAIVRQAVDDYKKELHALAKNPENRHAQSEASRIERFFHSDWYKLLTSMDPERLLAGVRLLVKKEVVQADARAVQHCVKGCLAEVGDILSVLEEREELNPEEQFRLKARSFEALNRAQTVEPIKREAERFGAEAIRRVGFRVRE